MPTSEHEHFQEIPGAEVFLVGGAVRDQYLGRAVVDRDWVVVGSHPKAMLDEGFRQVGSDFPVFLHPISGEEFALARQERKSGHGHKGFVTKIEEVTLEEDLQRRDLTINAMAFSKKNQLTDPFNGKSDLENRLLRHVSAAFSEDPLRVLRVARFAAQLADFEFSIAPETRELMQKMAASGELKSLTAERVWRETEKALQSTKPRVYFEALRSVGALHVVFPEVDSLFGIPQRPDFHPEIDAGLHTMLSLDQISEMTSDTRSRFAVLTHDLGKATTPEAILPRHTGHETRSSELTESLCQRLKVPNEYRQLARLVAKNHLLCHQCLRLRPKTIERLLTELGAWRQTSMVKEFTQCCMADARGRTGLESREYPQQAFLLESEAQCKQISTKSLLDKGYQGQQLGEQLRQLRLEQIRSIQKKYAHIDELSFARGISS